MGHAPAGSDMAAVYRERIDDDRLQAVAEHVRPLAVAGEAKAETKGEVIVKPPGIRLTRKSQTRFLSFLGRSFSGLTQCCFSCAASIKIVLVMPRPIFVSVAT